MLWFVTPTLKTYKNLAADTDIHSQETPSRSTKFSNVNTMNYYHSNYHGGLGHGLSGLVAWAMAPAMASEATVVMAVATSVPPSMRDTGHLDSIKYITICDDLFP